VSRSRTSAVCACAVLSVLVAACSGASRPAAVVRHAIHPRLVTPTTTTPPTTTTTQPTDPPSTSPVSIPAVPGWSAPLTTLPPGGGITSVSCLSDTYCISAGGGANQADAAGTTGAGLTASWDGETWSDPSTYYPAPTAPSGTWPVRPSLSCTSGPFCVIVDGSGYVSNGDGTDWITPVTLPTAPTLPDNPADPGVGHPGSRQAAVACPTQKFCAFVSNTGTAYTWRNGSWLTPQSFGTPVGASNATALYAQGRVGISCPNQSSCTAVVGTTVLDWNGAQWSQEPNPWILAADPHGVAVSCSTPTLCAVVSGAYLSYRNGTGGWSTPRSIDPGGVLDSISCPLPTFCAASDSGGSVLTFNGSTWTAPVRVLPAPTEYVTLGTSVDCTEAPFCMVISGDGDYTTYDPTAAPPAASGSLPTTTTTSPTG